MGRALQAWTYVVIKHTIKVGLLESQTKAAFKVWRIRPSMEEELVSKFTFLFVNIPSLHLLGI